MQFKGSKQAQATDDDFKPRNIWNERWGGFLGWIGLSVLGWLGGWGYASGYIVFFEVIAIISFGTAAVTFIRMIRRYKDIDRNSFGGEFMVALISIGGLLATAGEFTNPYGRPMTAAAVIIMATSCRSYLRRHARFYDRTPTNQDIMDAIRDLQEQPPHGLGTNGRKAD